MSSHENRPRTPLSERLNSLVVSNSAQSTPRSSLDAPNSAASTSTPPPPTMPLAPRAARIRPTSLPSSGIVLRSPISAALPPTSPTAASPSTVDAMLKSVQDQLPAPVLRWLNGSKPTTPPDSRSASPPHSSLANLDEALHEQMPRPPSPVAQRLPRFARPPVLGSLTRSTLPTASLSTPSALSHSSSLQSSASDSFLNDVPGSVHEHETSYDLLPDAPLFLRNRRRSSVDTLRSLQQRELHTSATARVKPSQSPNRWAWLQPSQKASAEPLLDEADQQGDAADTQEHLQKKYASPKHPVVFCHGLLGFDQVSIGPAIAPLQFNHWRGIKEVLEASGSEVLITRVPATSSPVDRAHVLAEAIEQTYPGRAVHLIGHSMGGLDCRYLASQITQRSFTVLSVTTIATPHRGSAFADHFLATVGIERMPSVLSLLDMLPNGGGDGRAFEFLTVGNMREFNESTPDVDGVRYFSWGATYQPGLIDTWKWPHSVVLDKEGPNDGLVSVASSKWGTYLGTLENVNHLDLVGWTNVARYRWAEIMGREIRFKPATFYLGVADHLARAVEGQEELDEVDGVVTRRSEDVTDKEGDRKQEDREREQIAERMEQRDTGTPQSGFSAPASAKGKAKASEPTSDLLVEAARRLPKTKASGDVLPGDANQKEGGASTGAVGRKSMESARRRPKRAEEELVDDLLP